MNMRRKWFLEYLANLEKNVLIGENWSNFKDADDNPFILHLRNAR